MNENSSKIKNSLNFSVLQKINKLKFKISRYFVTIIAEKQSSTHSMSLCESHMSTMHGNFHS